MKNTNNTTQASQMPLPFATDEIGALAVIKEGLEHEVDDLVRLELTAEQMLQDEIQLVRDYVADDANSFWQDIKAGLIQWELTAGEYLLAAADPTRVEWHLSQVWGDEESQFH